MKISNYLHFDGNCKEAFEHYAAVLGGKVTAMIPHTGSPAENFVPAEWKDKVLHACIELDGQLLMASDAPPGRFQKPQGFSVCLHVASPQEAERLYNALSPGGSISMPLGKTFFAESFAMVTDRFGTPWMINCPPNQH